ncbi:MAG: tetraacyldisaccharide 4'-kinase [Bacteroidales bacterium]|nr:tetraacyldisaccharide 4'-kinase [Bacteroidales bacterium]
MSLNRKNLALITFPVSLIYGTVIFIRNLLFDIGFLKQHSFPQPVISVGNITVGGTGKTPHVEYLVKLLEKECSVAVLSRGYKRKTKGFILASPGSGTDEIGDEPKQIKDKFPQIHVAVSEKRVEGVEGLLKTLPPPDVIILDDAFQHRYIKPALSILLVDYYRPVFSDFLLPFGNLREYRCAAKRADIIIVTKTPHELPVPEQQKIISRINPRPYQSVYFTTFSYGKPVPVYSENSIYANDEFLKSSQTGIALVTGIAYPKPLFEYLKNNYSTVLSVSFPDHHDFTLKEITGIKNKLEKMVINQKIIITTEKDAVRLRRLTGLDDELRQMMYYVPVEVEFLNNATDSFKKKITSLVMNKSM